MDRVIFRHKLPLHCFSFHSIGSILDEDGEFTRLTSGKEMIFRGERGYLGRQTPKTVLPQWTGVLVYLTQYEVVTGVVGLLPLFILGGTLNIVN